MDGTQLCDQGISTQVEHNPQTLSQFLHEISLTRQCRLRMANKWDETFTVEQLLADIQNRCRLPASTSLYGAIGRMARQRGLIQDTGVWVEAKRAERHCSKVPLCCWNAFPVG